MSTKKTRIKQPAIPHFVPHDRETCATAINDIGSLTRQITVLQASMNDEIAEITARYTSQFEPLIKQRDDLSAEVKVYCEANRTELTQAGEMKSATFITGRVQWRQRPPSVQSRGVESIITTLIERGLTRFVRVKQELNKDAMLNEPEAIIGIPGLSIKTGIEDFVIEPLDVVDGRLA